MSSRIVTIFKPARDSMGRKFMQVAEIFNASAVLSALDQDSKVVNGPNRRMFGMNRRSGSRGTQFEGIFRLYMEFMPTQWQCPRCGQHFIDQERHIHNTTGNECKPPPGACEHTVWYGPFYDREPDANNDKRYVISH